MAGMRPGLSAPRPLTVSDCAYYMGLSSEWIRTAIREGVTVHGRTVTLAAETIPHAHRTTYRIHEQQFLVFLQAIGWTHLPTHVGTPSPVPARPQAVTR
jgi:hypothetical protein